MPDAPMGRSRATLPVLFSVVVVDLIGFGIVIPVLPFYAESLGASATILGGLLASYAVMQFVFAPVWGRLSDRFGRRPIMLLTIAGTSLSLLGLGLAESLAGLLVARTLAGMFGANVSVATAYVTDVTAPEERTRWMAMIGVSFGVGFLLGPAIGGLLVPLGYEVPMLTAAALAALNLVLAIVTLREPERHHHEGPAHTSRRAVLRDPLVARLCLANLLFSIAMSQLETIFAFLMMDRFDYEAQQVAWILVGMALVMIAVQGGAIRSLAPRFGERRMLIGGTALLAASFLMIPWMPSVLLLLIPLTFASVGRGVGQPALMSLVSSAALPNSRGMVMGTFQSSASLARIVGPVAAGFLYDVALPVPFVLGALLLVAVALIGSRLPGSKGA